MKAGIDQGRIGCRTCLTRNATRQDRFEHIALFNNPNRKHATNVMLSPVDFEERQLNLHKAGI